MRHLSLRDDLSLRDEVKQPIVDAGAKGPFLRHSNSKNEDLLMQCASTLANLTENIEKQGFKSFLEKINWKNTLPGKIQSQEIQRE